MSDTLPTATVAAQPASEQPSVTIEVNATLLKVTTYDCNNGQCGTLGQHTISVQRPDEEAVTQPRYVQADNTMIMVTLALPNNTTVDAVVATTSDITVEQLQALTGKKVACEIDGTAAQEHRKALNDAQNGSTHPLTVLLAIEAAAELSR